MSTHRSFQDPDHFALDLAAQGYWVFPTSNYNKGARSATIRGEVMKWGEALNVPPEQAARNRDELAASLSIPSASRTGASLLLQPTDPVPICIIDLDPKTEEARGLSPETLWGLLFGKDVALPGGLGVVRTPSGGTHFYLRLPAAISALSVSVQKFPLAKGLHVDTRVSGGTTAHLMLPGSKTTDHSGGAGVRTYELINFPQRLEDLEPVPDAFVKRLMLRAPLQPTEEARIPTEVVHLLNVCKLLSPMSDGRNTFSAELGQVLGRMDLTWEGLPDNVVEKFWGCLGPKLVGYTKKQFCKAFRSAYKTGRHNAARFGVAAKKKASLGEVLEEFRLQFGADAWVKELVHPQGRSQGFRIGVGGSEETPEEAKYTVEVERLTDLNGVFAALVATSPDTREEDFFASPFFGHQGFRSILLQHFRTICRQERLGMPIEELLMNTISEAAVMAADGGHIRRGVSDGAAIRRDTEPFILVNPKRPSDLTFVIPAETHSLMVSSIQPVTKAQKIFTEMAHRKRERKVDTYRVAIQSLPERARTHILKQLKAKLTEAGKD